MDSAGQNVTLTRIQDTLLLPTWKHLHLQHLLPSSAHLTSQSEIPTRHQIPYFHSCHKLWALQNVNLLLRHQGTGRSHQNKTVKRLPVLTRTNSFCESDYKAVHCSSRTGCPTLKFWLLEMFLHNSGCPP